MEVPLTAVINAGLGVVVLYMGAVYVLPRLDRMVEALGEVAKNVAVLTEQQEGGYKFLIEKLLSDRINREEEGQ